MFLQVSAGDYTAGAEQTKAMALGDYDNDGFLDVLVGNIIRQDGASQFTLGQDQLFRNNGDGTFELQVLKGIEAFDNTEVFPEVLPDDRTVWPRQTYGVAMIDINNDGWLEYVLITTAHRHA